jgi:hypothetical protein
MAEETGYWCHVDKGSYFHNHIITSEASLSVTPLDSRYEPVQVIALLLLLPSQSSYIALVFCSKTEKLSPRQVIQRLMSLIRPRVLLHGS